MDVQQNKLEITSQEVPSSPEEVGPAVLDVLPDGHIQPTSTIHVLFRDGGLLANISEDGAPVRAAGVGRPPAPFTREHPFHLGLR